MIERATGELRAEYRKSGRGELFETLQPFLWEDARVSSLSEAAARLGMTTHALTMALHRLRRRVGEHLRARVAETVASGAEVDEELRHLIGSCGE